MIQRRDFVAGILGVLAAPLAAEAQQAGKVPRVGVLHPGSSKEAAAAQREPFERGLRELGWVPGSTVLIDYRYAEGNAERLPELAADLVRSRVDVIVARAPAAINAARQATASIPIVMSAGDNPVGQGWAKSLSRPGGNITGVVSLVLDLDGKRLEMLKEVFPRASNVAVVTNPNIDGGRHEENMAVLRASARALKLEIQLFELKRAEEIPAVSAAIGGVRIDALLVRGDPQVIDPNRSELVAMAARHRLPAVYWWRFFVEAGGLLSYGINFPVMHHRAATYVSRILRGANPGELAIEQPTRFELIINRRTARVLGLTIPQSILLRADEVIE